ncbi:hypothetical protein BpHYR1_015820 [Brachionus plicatilis]|uniref:Uncharacterized protein n=1 Tax=Brachionus plicatilis TaxID=10195 RepID=A0A3M7SNP9_BRAPC|nr:hypothetical protein BpHYR1_015820 [Brachionus plicatilis]
MESSFPSEIGQTSPVNKSALLLILKPTIDLWDKNFTKDAPKRGAPTLENEKKNQMVSPFKRVL